MTNGLWCEFYNEADRSWKAGQYSSSASASSLWVSSVHKVKLSCSNCIINMLSLCDPSLNVSSSAMVPSNAVFALEPIFSGDFRIS